MTQKKPLHLHIGAGQGQNLPEDTGQDQDYRAVLIEPNPHYAQSLSRFTTGDASDIVVLSAALAAKTGWAKFKICNFEELSALNIPDDLMELMPGLKIVDTVKVRTQTVRTLLRKLSLSGQDNRLVIEAAGQEQGIIDGLIQHKALDAFKSIMVRLRVPSMEPGTPEPEQLAEQLALHSFRRGDTEESEDPDWQILQFDRDDTLRPLLQQISEAKTQIDVLTQDMSDAKMQAAELDTALKKGRDAAARLQDTVAARDASLADLERQLADARQMVADQDDRLETAQTSLHTAQESLEQFAQDNTRLQKELDAAQSARDRSSQANAFELETLRMEVASRSKKLEAQTVELAQLRKEAEKASAQLATTQEQLKAAQATETQTRTALQHARENNIAMQKRNEELNDKAQAAQQARADLLQSNQNMKVQLKEAQSATHAQSRDDAFSDLQARHDTTCQDLSVALRMQALVGQDLRDLQERYAALKDEKHQQDMLMAQLVARLSEASTLLQNLALEEDGDVTPTLSVDDVKANVSKDRS